MQFTKMAVNRKGSNWRNSTREKHRKSLLYKKVLYNFLTDNYIIFITIILRRPQMAKNLLFFFVLLIITTVTYAQVPIKDYIPGITNGPTLWSTVRGTNPPGSLGLNSVSPADFLEIDEYYDMVSTHQSATIRMEGLFGSSGPTNPLTQISIEPIGIPLLHSAFSSSGDFVINHTSLGCPLSCAAYKMIFTNQSGGDILFGTGSNGPPKAGTVSNENEKMRITNAGNVGIGTISPEFHLSLDNDGGILAKGTDGSGTVLPSLGAGTRLIWYPYKSAFRVGRVTGTDWDDANIGEASIAEGQDCIAKGKWSVSFGEANNASGDQSACLGTNDISSDYSSVAIGNFNTASNYYSTAIGADNTSSGNTSTSIGGNCTATGDYSLATLENTTASGYSSLAMGDWVYSVGDFSVGIGTTDSVWGNSIAIGERNFAGNAVIGGGDSTIDGHSFSSPAVCIGIGNTATSEGNIAFGTWNVSNGDGSIAFGHGDYASGLISSAYGFHDTVAGTGAFAIGSALKATDSNCFIIGVGCQETKWNGTGAMMVNNLKNSLGIGFNSDIPTLVIDSSGGAGKTGSVGIGTGGQHPKQKLEVDSGNILLSNYSSSGIAGQLQFQSPSAHTGITSFQAGDQGTTSINYTLPTSLPTSADDVIVATTYTNPIQLAWGPGGSGGGGSDAWLLLGNSGTTPGVASGDNYLGTTDDKDMIIASDDKDRIHILGAGGYVGIGEASPQNPLVVSGGDVVNEYGGTDSNHCYRLLNTNDGTDWDMYQLNNSSYNANGFMIEHNFGGEDELEGHYFAINVTGGVSIGEDYVISTSSSTTTPAAGVLAVKGAIGIGTRSPTNMLDVTGSASIGYASTSAPSDGLIVSGNVGIGTSSTSGYPLYVNGYIDVSGTIYTSDERFKENVKPIDSALTKIMKLRGVEYNFLHEQYPNRNFPYGNQIGFIAQEMQKVVPEVVSTDDSGYEGIDYAKLTALLTAAVKEQQQTIAQQDSLLNNLTNRVVLLESASTQIVNGQTPAQPQVTATLQIVPNPFPNSTTISYSLSAPVANAQILVSNASNGQVVDLFSISNQTSGSIVVDGGNLISGTYRCSIAAGSNIFATQNMILIK